MKTNKSTLRLPTLQEFQNLVNFLSDDIQALNFQNYWYLTSDQPENKAFVQVFNPIQNHDMVEHISYEYNVRLVYDNGISIEWEKNDEASLTKKGKTKFTLDDALEHIQSIIFDTEKEQIVSNSNCLNQIEEYVENIKETYEEQIELLEDEIKRLRIIIEYLENQNGYKI